MKSKSIICLTGPSGVGKTTYANKLIEKHHFIQPKIVTTRKRRDDDGNHYTYVSDEQFIEMINSNLFIEWDRYLDNYYGTLLQDFCDCLKMDGVRGVILDLTPKGCNLVKKNYASAIIIALLPDDPDWLLKRLNSRNLQTKEEISKRTAMQKEYIDEVKNLSSDMVLTQYLEENGEATFSKIEAIIFRKTPELNLG